MAHTAPAARREKDRALGSNGRTWHSDLPQLEVGADGWNQSAIACQLKQEEQHTLAIIALAEMHVQPFVVRQLFRSGADGFQQGSESSIAADAAIYWDPADGPAPVRVRIHQSSTYTSFKHLGFKRAGTDYDTGTLGPSSGVAFFRCAGGHRSSSLVRRGSGSYTNSIECNTGDLMDSLHQSRSLEGNCSPGGL